MTGWRLGYGVVPPHLADAIVRMIVNSVSCVPPFVQWAGVAALKGSQEPVAKWVAELRRRRDALVAGLNDLPGVRCVLPQGAFYAFPNVTELCHRLSLPDADTLQNRWLREAGVATLARSCFGTPLPGETQVYLRFSYATSLERIEEGLHRLRRWLEQHLP
jgi:aspartate/methionine/tyrosine aminotransferase